MNSLKFPTIAGFLYKSVRNPAVHIPSAKITIQRNKVFPGAKPLSFEPSQVQKEYCEYHAGKCNANALKKVPKSRVSISAETVEKIKTLSERLKTLKEQSEKISSKALEVEKNNPWDKVGHNLLRGIEDEIHHEYNQVSQELSKELDHFWKNMKK